MNRSAKLLAGLFLVGGLAFSSAADTDWTAGAFEDEGTKLKSTTVSAKPFFDDSTRFEYKFTKPTSNSAYAQIQLKAASNKKYLMLQVKSTIVADAEVWIETEGWKFQGKIQLKPVKKWQELKLALKDVDSSKVKYLRIIIAPKGNPKHGVILLKDPQLSK
jgi:hypothetical protein